MKKVNDDVLVGFYGSGIYINDNSEYCQLHSYYDKNTEKFRIYFSQPNVEMASRPALYTTSKNKIVKFLKSENFKLTKFKDMSEIK